MRLQLSCSRVPVAVARLQLSAVVVGVVVVVVSSPEIVTPVVFFAIAMRS